MRLLPKFQFKKYISKLVRYCLQVRLFVLFLYVLGAKAVYQLSGHYRINQYTYIPRDQIDSLLYRKLNPNLALNSTAPECKYDLTGPSKPLHMYAIPSRFDKFLPTGIVNGSYWPQRCRPAFSVALVVPYRNRKQQLERFLPYMHDFLRKQHIHYKIFVVEQEDDYVYNKGVLLNAGVRQAIVEDFPCVIPHDVDLFPLDENNLYACLQQPRHLSGKVDRLRMVLVYPELVGGVVAIRADQFVMVNGYSNWFFGWGGEDDNFADRLSAHKLEILRFPADMSRYSMLMHAEVPVNRARRRLLRDNRQDFQRDGLNSFAVLSINVTQYQLYTHIGIKVHPKQPYFPLNLTLVII